LAVFVPCHQGEFFKLRLRDKHPVERIAVNHRQSSSGDGVVGADEQGPEPAFLDPLGEPGRLRQLADRLLDGDFPDSRRADIDVGLVIEPVLDVVGERLVVS
jgi:hypothetical protein